MVVAVPNQLSLSVTADLAVVKAVCFRIAVLGMACQNFGDFLEGGVAVTALLDS